MLTSKVAASLKPKEKKYRRSDRDGLYLMVLPGGTKSWRWNYKDIDKKNKTKTFGTFPMVGVAEARELHREFRQRLAKGLESGSSGSMVTFDDIKQKWLRHKLAQLKSVKHQQQVLYRVNHFVSPKIGGMPLDEIRRSDLVKIVQDAEALGLGETSHRIGMSIRQVFDFAMDLGVIENHPAAGLSRVLGNTKPVSMACVPLDEVGKLVKDLEEVPSLITRNALQLVMHTFVRSSELRHMEWSEIKDGKFWVVPESRMKVGKPHVVPLSFSSLQILDNLRPFTGEDKYVFQSPLKKNQPISENTKLDALYVLGYKGRMTVHGFRSLASTVLNEKSPFSHEVIERQLAHKEKDLVRAAYNRAEYLDERVKLMDWWSGWLNNLD